MNACCIKEIPREASRSLHKWLHPANHRIRSLAGVYRRRTFKAPASTNVTNGGTTAKDGLCCWISVALNGSTFSWECADGSEVETTFPWNWSFVLLRRFYLLGSAHRTPPTDRWNALIVSLKNSACLYCFRRIVINLHCIVEVGR